MPYLEPKPLTDDDERHGTYAGYQAHRHQDVPTCEPCRTANAAYMKDLRARRPDIRERGNRRHRAESRAVWRLARRYPDEFRALVLEELARDKPKGGAA